MNPAAVLATAELDRIFAPLRTANLAHAALRPGDRADRQPVHTVYGGAHLFRADSAQKLGKLALRTLDEHAPQGATMAAAMGLEIPEALADTVRARVVAKLRVEPVEDMRIDFEDGYGNRPDAEEDGHAISTASEVAQGLAAGTLPPFLGVRIKPLTEELRGRSARTLALFLATLAEASGGVFPPGFVVTLPKVQIPEQVAAVAEMLAVLERQLGLDDGALRLELMIEEPHAIIDHRGEVALPRLVAAGRGRCVAAHFGTYDYTASCGITAAHQHLAHPACDFAKHVMQVSLAGTGIWLSDGATNVLPIGDRAAVHAGWRLHAGHVRHSLSGGYYQGWDLHPAQLPARYAAVYAFFLASLGPATARLASFVEKAARATLAGAVFDDAATGQGLLNFFLRGLACGAVTEAEALRTGLSQAELRTRSFSTILARRAR